MSGIITDMYGEVTAKLSALIHKYVCYHNSVKNRTNNYRRTKKVLI